MKAGTPKSPSAIEHAARLRARERIAALGQGLLVASPADRDAIAMMLIEMASVQGAGGTQGSGDGRAAGPIELLTRLPQQWRARHSDEALAALARGWGNLSEPMRRLAVGLGRDRWLRAAGELAGDPDTGCRLAALSIARDTADPGLGKIVAELLADEQQSVRKAADEAMMRMTLRLVDHLPDALLGEELARIAARPRVPLPVEPGVLALERCILLGAVADAAWSFSAHRCRSPLISALLLVDRAVATPMERRIGLRIKRLLSERSHPSHAPLRTVLKRTPCPILRERALRWLAIEAISGAAMERLAEADSLLEHELVLTRAHLAMRPTRAAALGSFKQTRGALGVRRAGAGGMLPGRDRWDELSEDARVGLLSYSALVPGEETARRALQEPALADGSARVRLTASELCSPLDLSDYLYDTQPSIARHAALRWSSLGHDAPRPGSAAWTHRTRIAGLCDRSPHAWVRRVANEEAARISMFRPGSPASRVQARRMLTSDPAGFVRLVRDRLADADTRLAAIMLIRMLGLESRFELDLISLAQNEQIDARDRATAVVALGRVDTDAARRIMREALGDGDTRIRANAVEWIDENPGKILELKRDDHHRVRASAIRRVIRDSGNDRSATGKQAGEALLEMLCDDRQAHRLAAAWAAQRAVTGANRELLGNAFKPLIGRIEVLAANDNDARVRGRASRCIHRVGEDLRNARSLSDSAVLDQIRGDVYRGGLSA